MSHQIIIRKQKINIKTGSEQEALMVRKLIMEIYEHEFGSLLERVFQFEVPKDSYLTLDSLKINLGAISHQDLERRLIELTESKLIQAVQRQLVENQQAFFSTHGNEQEGPDHNDGHNSSQSLQINTTRQQETNALFSFLEKGVYPWWYQKEHQKTPGQLLAALGQDKTNLLQWMIGMQSAPSIDNIIERLFIHADDEEYEDLLATLSRLRHEATLTQSKEEIIRNKEAILDLLSLSEKKFYEFLFRYLLSNHDSTIQNKTLSFLQHIIEKEKYPVDRLKTRMGNIPASETEWINTVSMLVQQEDIELKNAETGQNKNSTDRPAKNRSGIEKGLYIHNAGLVLLHPFLSMLFSQVGLLDEHNCFISGATQYKAVVLLYYLQCGSTGYQEWDMALNKILCRLPYEDVLPEGIILSENEMKEAEELLQTVVQYWEALRGCSIEALQNTFLLREGKVTWKEDNWLIQVERTGVDILLDQLPWGYCTIKLPWLNQLIYTEW